jgi:hypothetical protein
MHEEALFCTLRRKTLTGYKNWILQAPPPPPLLKATDSFPDITELTGFDLKVSFRFMYFGFLFFSSIIWIVQIELHHNPAAYSHSPCQSRGFYIIGGRAFFRCFCKIANSDYWLSHVRPSVCPHGTTRLSLDGFSWNLVFENFLKLTWENSNFIKIGQEERVLHMMTNIHFWSYVARFFLEWEMFQTNVVEKVKTHFCSVIFFFWHFAFNEKMWKNIVERGRPQMTIWRMRIACWIPATTNTNKHTHSHTLRLCNTHCFSNCNTGCTNAPYCYLHCYLHCLSWVFCLYQTACCVISSLVNCNQLYQL